MRPVVEYALRQRHAWHALVGHQSCDTPGDIHRGALQLYRQLHTALGEVTVEDLFIYRNQLEDLFTPRTCTMVDHLISLLKETPNELQSVRTQ